MAATHASVRHRQHSPCSDEASVSSILPRYRPQSPSSFAAGMPDSRSAFATAAQLPAAIDLDQIAMKHVTIMAARRRHAVAR
ncbi:MAG: hypothetical protein QM581_10665 [Pseudomonas sp.]